MPYGINLDMCDDSSLKDLLSDKQEIELGEKGKIVAETARISWKDLEIFYARGMAILVSPALDLIEVAHCLSLDESDQIEQWLNSEKLLRTFDEQAKTWSERDEDVWSVVVKPWVLVQEVTGSS